LTAFILERSFRSHFFSVITVISFRTSALLAGVLAVTACSDSTGPSFNDPTTRITVDASSNAGAYLLLGNPATIATSANWDLFFNATDVAANGGVSGSGNVSVYAATNNTTKTNAQVLATTQQAGLTAFNAVTVSSIPSDTTLFKQDALALAISNWYTMSGPTFTPQGIWSVRLASSPTAYAKFHVTAITPLGAPPANTNVTVQWATQATYAGTLGSDQSVTLGLVYNTTTYLNLTTGASQSGTAPAAWDVSFTYLSSGFQIRVNGAMGAAAISITDEVPSATYAGLTSATTIGGTAIPTTVFKTDGTGGAFASTPWYRYDIDPANAHQITPTYDVYIVKRGAQYYKVQVISYYGKGGDNSGTTRHIVVRYALLATAG